MPVVPIGHPGDARLDDYRGLSASWDARFGDLFIAEGRLVVRVLLTAARVHARSLLVTETALAALSDVVDPRLNDLEVFLVPSGVIEEVTGFNLERGCLAVGQRPRPVSVEDLLGQAPGARRLVVLEQVANADNVGGIFRSAAAFGADAVVIGPNCCDPLYRKAIRVSMGAALRVPFAVARAWPGDLDVVAAAGFTLVALTPAADAVDIATFAGELPASSRVAVLVGSEGAGLSRTALGRAAVRVRIPMAPGVDSLNVATAAAIALHRF
jgi:tRNA G18 (ribose-2'-O)-methylase SpoU